MKVNLSGQQLKHWLIFAIGLAAAGFAAYQSVADGHPSIIAIAAAVVLGVERYVSDPSTGTPTPPGA